MTYGDYNMNGGIGGLTFMNGTFRYKPADIAAQIGPLQNLYTEYKICKIVVQFKPKWDTGQFSFSNNYLDGVDMGHFIYGTDPTYTLAAPASLLSAFTAAGSKMVKGQRGIKLKFTPTIAVPAYPAGAGDYTYKKSTWMSTADDDIEHYGWWYVWEGLIPAAKIVSFHYIVKYYVAYRKFNGNQ